MFEHPKKLIPEKGCFVTLLLMWERAISKAALHFCSNEKSQHKPFQKAQNTRESITKALRYSFRPTTLHFTLLWPAST